MSQWKFYGRRDQLTSIQQMLDRGRWFFAKITGRSRIGKTTLIQQALQSLTRKKPVFYVQIPDSEAIGILSAVNDALDTFGVPANKFSRPTDMNQLAKLIESMAANGYVVVMDEFQYFRRKGHEEFCSHLQAAGSTRNAAVVVWETFLSPGASRDTGTKLTPRSTWSLSTNRIR